MDWSLLNIAIVTVIICLGSILQAVTGLGAGLIIVPLLAFVSYELIPAPMIFGSLALTIIMTVRGWKHIDFTHIKFLLLSLLLGIVLGASVITYLPLSKMGTIFGILILVAVFASVLTSTTQHNVKMYPFIGALSGFMGTVSAVGAPILAILYQYKSGPSLRATLAFLYCVSSVAILICLFFVGKFGLVQLESGMYMIPGFLLGYFIAPLFIPWVDRGNSRPIVLLLSSVSALILIFR